MNRLRTALEGAKHEVVDARVWIAWVAVSGDRVEGRGKNREEAVADLIDKLAERLEAS